MLRFSVPIAILLLLACWQVCMGPTANRTIATTLTQSADKTRWPRRIDAQYLPNPIRLHTKVISGGTPHGDDAFKELQSLGVKTIISVDGKKPDVAAAERYGIRYVHLPHGYDGIPQQRVKELAIGIRSLDGPIYIHCHHGKHRSPAAAVVACIASGEMAPADGLNVLAIAGTSPEYRGLFEVVRNVTPLNEKVLQEFSVEFRESVEVPPMAEAMVAIEQTHDRLKAVEAAGWKTPKDHPDLDPAHEALLLREHFSELLRMESSQPEDEKFTQLVRESIQAAQNLEEALRVGRQDMAKAQQHSSFSRFAARIEANCKACHRQLRDVPLSEY